MRGPGGPAAPAAGRGRRGTRVAGPRTARECRRGRAAWGCRRDRDGRAAATGARPGPAGDHRHCHRDPDRRAQPGADHAGGGGRRNRCQLCRRHRRGRQPAGRRRGGRYRTAARRRHAMGGGTMEQPVMVAIIEDHPVVTEGVASWIWSDPGQRVRLVQTARDLTELGAVRGPSADVVILDLELSGELVTAQIPGLVTAGYRVVAFSGHSDPVIVMETLDNGAHAYVSKEEGRDHLVEAVLAAAADRPYVTRSQARAMLADQRPARPALSEQERQALLLWFQGMSKASVGRRMSISENTVRQYISRARAKYAATGRTAPSKDALLARAIEDGVIKPNEIMPYTSFARAAANRPSLGAPGQ